MIQSLPLLSDDEVVCRASSSLAADDEPGFGSLATARPPARSQWMFAAGLTVGGRE